MKLILTKYLTIYKNYVNCSIYFIQEKEGSERNDWLLPLNFNDRISDI